MAMRWAGHVARMEMRNACYIFVGNNDSKRQPLRLGADC